MKRDYELRRYPGIRSKTLDEIKKALGGLGLELGADYILGPKEKSKLRPFIREWTRIMRERGMLS